MQNIADDVQRGITRNSEAAERLLNHIDQIASDIKGLTGGETNRNVRDSVKNIREITESVKKLLGAGEGQVNTTADKIKSELDKISVTLDKFNQSLDDVQQVTGRMAKGEGTVGRLLKDETIADNITDITQDTSDFIRTITRLQTIVGVREEYHTFFSDYSSLGNFKTYLTLRLQPHPDKYYLIELIDDPRGSKTYSHTLTATSSTPGQPPTVTNTDTYTRTPAFRFSFMFAKRVFLWNTMGLTGRIGIKESTGGLGGDLDLWGERFTLSLDIFDFLAEKYPRLKIMAAIEFIRHFWLVAGLDDLLNGAGNDRVQGLTCGPATPASWCQDGRTFFVGLQLTFNDKDLAALLTVGGSAISGAAK
jgi:phospholipid/cholesterol/gamma-HCH transport system substrate-binding protein